MKLEKAINTVGESIPGSIGLLAEKSMLEEVYTSPKPGLVDLYSNGAHTDMDVASFERSAKALRPWFAEMASFGEASADPVTGCTPSELFLQIRPIGLKAEADMLAATGGVNTHKGLIFTMGIYSAAAGRLYAEPGRTLRPTAEELRAMQMTMTEAVLKEEIRQLKLHQKSWHSHGEENLQHYGATGVRGEALAGYPALWEIALPELQRGLAEGRDRNLVKLQTLMTVMRCMEDSNVLARRDPETLREVQQQAAEFLKAGGAYAPDAVKRLEEMDAQFIQLNVSPGGCADILAAAVFLDGLLKMNI